MNPRHLLAVALGGTIGSAARLGGLLLVPGGDLQPLATAGVNLLGAFLLGVVAARVRSGSALRDMLGVGVLGGFTSYSALALGAAGLATGHPGLAAGYVAVSLGGGFLATAAGLRIARPRRSR